MVGGPGPGPGLIVCVMGGRGRYSLESLTLALVPLFQHIPPLG